MEKQRLAGGDITVWHDTADDETVIHHKDGLTIALNHDEAIALLKWLHHMNNVWLDQEDERHN